MGKPVLYAKHESLAMLTLNRPPLNLVDRDFLAALGGAVDKAAADEDVRVVVVTGGEDFFSEGVDLEEFNSLRIGPRRDFVRLGQDTLLALEHLPKPTIAAMAGKVLGAGLEIALACDMRVASEESQFGHPEVPAGTVPLFGNLYRLERLLGKSRARSFVFFGEPIPAWEALEIGLIGKVAPHGVLLDEARIAAARVAAKPMEAVRAAKISMIKGESEGFKIMLDWIVESASQLSKTRTRANRSKLSPNRE